MQAKDAEGTQTTQGVPPLPGEFIGPPRTRGKRMIRAFPDAKLTECTECITLHCMKDLSRQIVVRIPQALDARLRRWARAARRRPSEIVRLALEAYLSEPSGRVQDRIYDLIGSVSGGPDDLSTNRAYLLKALRGRR